ncbi:Vacuolar protein sorting-associated protein atg6 [Cryptotrichosporon argae]
MTNSATCQRCYQPLLLDPTVAHLSPASYQLLTSTLPRSAPTVPPPLSAALSALPPTAHPAASIYASSPADSYILLSPSAHVPGPAPAPSTSPQTPQSLLAHLHDLVSSATPIDHPLCADCTGLLQAALQKEHEELSRERDAYIGFERGVKAREADWAALEQRKKELEQEESELRDVLRQKEAELEDARREEARIKQEEARIAAEEDELLQEHAALHTTLTHLRASLSTAQTTLLLSTSHLQHLESANVYNDAFQIGHVAADPTDPSASRVSVGTINGLRLGGRPAVDWDEINAAWGLVALCIDRLAVRLGMTFETYRIVPLGSYSRIDELPPAKGAYELYASSDLSPARLLHNRRFNHALVGVLDCLRQLLDWGRARDRAWAKDVDITKDRINGHSIRLPGITSGMPAMPALPSMSLMGLGSGSGAGAGSAAGTGPPAADHHAERDGTPDEQWTRACRTVLVVLKRVLVHESEAEHADAARRP